MGDVPLCDGAGKVRDETGLLVGRCEGCPACRAVASAYWERRYRAARERLDEVRRRLGPHEKHWPSGVPVGRVGPRPGEATSVRAEAAEYLDTLERAYKGATMPATVSELAEFVHRLCSEAARPVGDALYAARDLIARWEAECKAPTPDTGGQISMSQADRDGLKLIIAARLWGLRPATVADLRTAEARPEQVSVQKGDAVLLKEHVHDYGGKVVIVEYVNVHCISGDGTRFVVDGSSVFATRPDAPPDGGASRTMEAWAVATGEDRRERDTSDGKRGQGRRETEGNRSDSPVGSSRDVEQPRRDVGGNDRAVGAGASVHEGTLRAKALNRLERRARTVRACGEALKEMGFAAAAAALEKWGEGRKG